METLSLTGGEVVGGNVMISRWEVPLDVRALSYPAKARPMRDSLDRANEEILDTGSKEKPRRRNGGGYVKLSNKGKLLAHLSCGCRADGVASPDMFPRVYFAAASFARHSQLALEIWIVPQPWVNLKHSTSAGNKSSDSEAFGHGSIVLMCTHFGGQRRPTASNGWADGLPSLIELQLFCLQDDSLTVKPDVEGRLEALMASVGGLDGLLRLQYIFKERFGLIQLTLTMSVHLRCGCMCYKAYIGCSNVRKSSNKPRVEAGPDG
ncbi:hypothetical protein B0H11DRAFT_1919492 [Mycena galericulata]|nr:hypothetical protein B0H11DRAFT_1919492 [Mycena galericulata]